MKKKLILITSIFFVAMPAFSQADKVVGIWLTDEGKSQIEIYKNSNGTFSGKIIWIKEDKEVKDDKNPNPKLRSRKIQGLEILSNFKYNNEDKEWTKGLIYDPESGKTYDCFMWFENKNYNLLKIKGFVLGIRFLGRETEWKRNK